MVSSAWASVSFLYAREVCSSDFSGADFPEGMPREGGCGVSAQCRSVLGVSMYLEAHRWLGLIPGLPDSVSPGGT